MAVTGHGATFSFSSQKGSFTGEITKITVEHPAAEIVDVTGINDATDSTILVPTGAFKGGTINVEFNATTSSPSVSSLVRGYGQLSLSSASGFTVSKQAVLESATESAAVGDVVRGSMRFLMTDWY